MNAARAFNKKIKKFLKEQPDSIPSNIIRKVISVYPEGKCYYEIFDDFSYYMGINLSYQPLLNRNNNIKGYIPLLKYHDDNAWNKTV